MTPAQVEQAQKLLTLRTQRLEQIQRLNEVTSSKPDQTWMVQVMPVGNTLHATIVLNEDDDDVDPVFDALKHTLRGRLDHIEAQLKELGVTL